MRTKHTYLVMLIAGAIAFALTSCGNEFWPADNELVGKWVMDLGKNEKDSSDWNIQFKNKQKLSMQKRMVVIPIVEEDQTKGYIHRNYSYKGTYSLTEDVVSMHITEINYNVTVYYNHEKVEDRTISLSPYDELAKFELDDYRNNLKLIRHYYTDSVRSQYFYKQKFK